MFPTLGLLLFLLSNHFTFTVMYSGAGGAAIYYSDDHSRCAVFHNDKLYPCSVETSNRFHWKYGTITPKPERGKAIFEDEK